MEAENDPIAEVNKRIMELQEGTVELTKGAFEGIPLPEEFDRTLRDLEAFPEEEDDAFEEQTIGATGEEAEEIPQTSLKVLKSLLKDEETLGQSSGKRPVGETDNIAFSKMNPAMWGQITDEELQEMNDESKTEREDKEEEVPEEEYHPRARSSKGWDEAVTEPLELVELVDRMSQLGVSMNMKELSVLKRKHSVMGGLSVRDGMMFIEGLRSANTISEAQITESLKGFSKALEQQKAHVRNLEKSVSEIKMAEKNYLELLEKVGAEKASVQEKVDKQVKLMVEIERKKLISKREEKEKELMEELRAKKEKILSTFKERASGSGGSSPRVILKKEQPIQSKLIKKEEKETIYRPSPFEPTYSEMEAGAELTSLSEYIGKGISKLAGHYDMTVEQVNESLVGFPKTTAGWANKFKNPVSAADAVHRHLIGRESRTE